MLLGHRVSLAVPAPAKYSMVASGHGHDFRLEPRRGPRAVTCPTIAQRTGHDQVTILRAVDLGQAEAVVTVLQLGSTRLGVAVRPHLRCVAAAGFLRLAAAAIAGDDALVDGAVARPRGGW